MIAVLWFFAILGVLLLALLIAAVLWASESPSRDTETLAKVEVELHRIGRKLDVALNAVEARREADRLKREFRDDLGVVSAKPRKRP